MDVRTGDQLSVPEPFETSIENGMEGGGVDPHRGDESAVVVALIQTYPRCSNTRVGEQAQPSKVLPAGAPITGGRGGITQGVSFEFFESFLLIYSHNTHWVNFKFFQKLLTTLIKTYPQGNF